MLFPREKTGPGTRTWIDILVITAAVKIAKGKNQVLKVTGNSKNSYVIPLTKKFNYWKCIFLKSFVDGTFEIWVHLVKRFRSGSGMWNVFIRLQLS